jgi:DnaK suppressor protein
MPDLSDAEGAELQAALEALRDELQRMVSAAAEAAAPVDLDEPIGRLSRVDAMQQQAMVQAGRQAAKLRLQQVEAALRRCESDDYGACRECGDIIDVARLRARPEAPFCLKCQSRSEARRG